MDYWFKKQCSWRLCIIIVGNKSDLNYKVESEEAKNFTEKN